jgi:hypothetical protein
MERNDMKLFGIINDKGELATYDVESNGDAEDCGALKYSISFNKWDHLWLVDSESTANKAIRISTPWYNAGYDTPEHTDLFKKANGKRAVELELTIQHNLLNGEK